MSENGSEMDMSRYELQPKQCVKREIVQEDGLIAAYDGTTTIEDSRYRFRIDPPGDNTWGKILLEDTCLRDQWYELHPSPRLCGVCRCKQ